MANKKLCFGIDASQIDIKPILKKEFLELKMKAISTANPNRNNSWFTLESLKDSIDTFKNKPILGYFENGDFVSHNGTWEKDPETGMDYWDTYGKKGERVLGLIREGDELKIVEDENGLYWLCFSCALWVQYNFKQVKRLLKDAKRAKENGDTTKNISVEVDIVDYEELPNGVLKINKFNLVGVTILGSRNGVKVEPGIEDAELSVVDIMGKELYEKQTQSIRLAYERLDGSEKNKEEFSKVDKLQTGNTAENVVTASNTLATDAQENANSDKVENFAANEENGVGNGTSSAEDNSQQNFEDDAENKGSESQSNKTEENKEDFADKGDDEDDDNEDDDEDEKKCEKCGKYPCECGDKHENECLGCPECSADETPKTKAETMCDLAWLVSDLSWDIERFNQSIEYYESHEDAVGRNYILPIIKRMKLQCSDNAVELAEALAKVASEEYADNEELNQYESALAENYNCRTLYDEVCALKAEKEALETSVKENEAKLASYAKAEFLESAQALIKSANLTEEVAKDFYSKCEAGEITTMEDLKTKVALYVFDHPTAKKEEEVKPEKATESFEAPVANIDTTKVFKEEKSAKTDKWASLRRYVKEE